VFVVAPTGWIFGGLVTIGTPIAASVSIGRPRSPPALATSTTAAVLAPFPYEKSPAGERGSGEFGDEAVARFIIVNIRDPLGFRREESTSQGSAQARGQRFLVPVFNPEVAL
jgi:hypothetical protein